MELAFDTVAYGIGNWHLYSGDTAKAQEYFRRILKGHVWVTWDSLGRKRSSNGRRHNKSDRPCQDGRRSAVLLRMAPSCAALGRQSRQRWSDSRASRPLYCVN